MKTYSERSLKKYTIKAIEKLQKHGKMTPEGGVKVSEIKKLLAKKCGAETIDALWRSGDLKDKVKQWTLDKVIELANEKERRVEAGSKKRKREAGGTAGAATHDSSGDDDDASGNDNNKRRQTELASSGVGKASKRETPVVTAHRSGVPRRDYVALDDVDARRVSVREFRNKLYVDIREMYVDRQTLEVRPSKKGISLTEDQWQRLVESTAQVGEIIAAAKKNKR